MPEEYERNQLARLAQIFFKAHVLNFLVSVVITLIIGGAATWGYQKEGHFFVGQHGHYVEVSKGVFEFSNIHVTYSLITVLIALVGGMFQKKTSSRIKLSWKEWALASIVPLFWFSIFLIVWKRGVSS